MTTNIALLTDLEGPRDGQVTEYLFGDRAYWAVKTTSLREAILAFRVGALFPDTYADKRRRDSERHLPSGMHVPNTKSTYTIYTQSEPGARIPISYRLLDGRLHQIDSIPVRDLSIEAAVGSTSLSVVSEDTRPRADVEADFLKIVEQRAELERMQRELKAQADKLKTELTAAKEKIWVIELFLGTHSRVKVLREGRAGAASDCIMVKQSVPCMDEEMAVDMGLRDPNSVGSFEAADIKAFDDWILNNLDAYLPGSKGIMAWRVRRNPKERFSTDLGSILADISAAQADRMTYFIVKNGERVYRLWADIQVWPRFFAREGEFSWDGSDLPLHNLRGLSWEDRHKLLDVNINCFGDLRRAADATLLEMGFDQSKIDIWREYLSPEAVRDSLYATSAREKLEATHKNYLAGLVVLQGVIANSDLLAPTIPGLDVFNPHHVEEQFHLVRDDEGNAALGDGDILQRVTWKSYKKWLKGCLREGVRVFFSGRNWGREELEERVGISSVSCGPSHDEIYTLGGKHRYGEYSFLYLPKDDVYTQDWEVRKRTRRVRWGCYSNEVFPIDYMSWRVLEHLIRDRSQRGAYGSFMPLAFRFWRVVRAEAEAEKPFIDLVLKQAGLGEESRMRAERLTRWWRIKNKVTRAVSEDEAKALRMIVKALKRGDDVEDDPETYLETL